MFDIEQNIPIPTDKRRSPYPWQEMKVGDSFFVPGKKMASVSSACTFQKKKTGREYVTRCVDGGVRVWRVV